MKNEKPTLAASVLAILAGAATAYLTKGTSGVHLPLLAAAIGGILIGFADPKKGWIAATVQALTVSLLVLFVREEGAVPEIEKHSLFGAIGLGYAGSFIGAFIKRALQS